MPTLHDPLWLLLLIPLALIAVLRHRSRRRRAIVFSDVSIPRSLPATWALRVKRFLPILVYASLALLIVALARPQWGREIADTRTEGLAIEMCIDRSGSMAALDFELNGKRVNRLTAVKDVFRKFVLGGDELTGREKDLIGLVGFGGYVDDLSALTLDHTMLVDEKLEEIKLPEEITDAQGRVINSKVLEEEQLTALGDAVMVAIQRLENSDAKSKIIILLTDGKQTAGAVQPLEAAEAAQALGIKIYTIAVGRSGRVPFPTGRRNLLGQQQYVYQETPVDVETLNGMARLTGGQYFHAENTDALAAVYDEIDKLEKSAIKTNAYTEYDEWFTVPLWAGLGLLLSSIVLTSTRFRSLP